MAEIAITGGIVIVDDDDACLVLSKNWAVNSDGYAYSNGFLHRFIFGEVPDGLFVDHANRNRLDNRRCNLRLATRAQNNANRSLSRRNKSGFTGVQYLEKIDRWRVSIENASKRAHYFKTKELAVEFRQLADELKYGEFASHLN